ncbi:hypothetical protein RRU01S_27_00980 [Agrobacterium rubi TR3 = NBRC 13261]|uniref:Uncharacterized protein n=1 Tax=Agrobacterium rubi TR3 = NBRC 13261 TaxID=1368415 RepID=A0A081D1B3_9HYPH|nr:hypothetical protein [Agrobacterium rubi]MBP1880537.1 hypothetical protein [Agrobacterium rubi]GAK72709.1 hypothetical protein RRU01S_27_00980 [Agrobacterium rubi TR3 = NBRC 13261]
MDHRDLASTVNIRGEAGWREVEIRRGSSNATCPIFSVKIWLKLANIAHSALFHRVIGQGKAVGTDRLNDKLVARLVKTAAIEASVQSDLAEHARGTLFAGHLVRAGLASSAEVDERYVQK